MMDPTLVEVVDKTLLKEYIFLPEKVYASYPHWVPPLYTDEWNFHNPKHNEALATSEVFRLIARHGKDPVGRIMGIINEKHNAQHGEKTARFFNLDCVNDSNTSKSLLSAIETWARKKGMNRLIGPYGFSDKDPQGIQVDGFGNLPVIAAPSNPPFIQSLIESAGFTKKLDCVSYQLPVAEILSPAFERIHERAKRNSQVRLVEFTAKRQAKPFIQPVFKLVNETYAPLFGFVPMSNDEIRKFADQYISVLDPEFVKLVVDPTGTPVAFAIAMPDMSKGMQKAKGRLFPFGFIHILKAMKTATQLNLLLGAVHPSYRGKGLTILLAKALFLAAARRGMTTADSHLILESNHLMRGECEHAGGKLYKRFRVYQKEI